VRGGFAKVRNLTNVHVKELMCRTILVTLSLLAFLSVLTDSDSESSNPFSLGLATEVPMAAHVASAPPAPPAFGLPTVDSNFDTGLSRDFGKE
jgi:hypothetical protein